MTELEILKIIEQGHNTNSPADITLKVIKQHCENVINQMESELCEKPTKVQQI